jgi:CDP-diacylglycerol---serine O-phosphatidyltransferase
MIKRNVPNSLTAFNLLLGVVSIILTIEGQIYYAALMVIAAGLMDGLDGRVARMLKVSSEFGKELDSLADLVSFGVAPALLAYAVSLNHLGVLGYIIAGVFAVCGAIRLARFNLMDVKGYFLGLPIPAAGCIISTFVISGINPHMWLFPIMVTGLAYLMVSRIKYPDFKKAGAQKIKRLPIFISASLFVYVAISNPQTLLFLPLATYAVYGIINLIFTWGEVTEIVEVTEK